ncbi:MAG TPA: response regulator [Firmicutes bacterium]|nr:response regulator [Bacillota bacterium]
MWLALVVHRLIIADADQVSCSNVCEYLKHVEDMQVVATVFQPEQVLSAIAEHKPDLLLLDFMAQSAGRCLLKALYKAAPELKIVIYTTEGSVSSISQATAAGVDYYVLKPFELSILVQRLRQVLTSPFSEDRADYDTDQLQAQVRRCLQHLGVPERFKGYSYLCTAIVLCYHDETYLTRVMKALYPTIAEQWRTTPPRVERAIRYALEVTWTHGNLGLIDRLFHYTVDQERAKPTNASFIAHLVDAIRFGRIDVETPQQHQKLG